MLPRAFPELQLYLDDYDGVVIGHMRMQLRAHVDGKLIVNSGVSANLETTTRGQRTRCWTSQTQL